MFVMHQQRLSLDKILSHRALERSYNQMRQLLAHGHLRSLQLQQLEIQGGFLANRWPPARQARIIISQEQATQGVFRGLLLCFVMDRASQHRGRYCRPSNCMAITLHELPAHDRCNLHLRNKHWAGWICRVHRERKAYCHRPSE